MATERQDAASTITPTAPIAQSGGRALQAFATVEERAASENASMAGNLATVGFGIMKDQALKQAQEEASGIVQYDDKNQLVVPKSFNPPGIGGIAYNETYRKAAIEYYRSAALTEYQASAAAVVAKMPNDPDGVSVALKALATSKIDALDPSVRGSMIPHYESVRSSAITSATAGRERVNQHETTAQLGRTFVGLVADSAKDGLAAGLGQHPPEVIEANRARINDRWAMWEAQALGNGWTPQQIEGKKKEFSVSVAASIVGRQIYDAVSQRGDNNPELQKKVREDIDKFVEENPGYKAEASTILEGYLSRANAISATETATRNKVADGVTAAGIDDKVRLEMMRRDGFSTATEIADAEAKVSQDARTRIQNANISPLQRATAMASVLTNRSVVESSYATAVSQMTAIAADPQKASQHQYALGELETFRNNPVVHQMAASSPVMQAIVRQADATITTAFNNSNAYDAGTAISKISAGTMDPGGYASNIQAMISKGVFGPGSNVSPAAIAAAVSAGTTAWNTNQAGRTLAANAATAWQDPVNPSPPVGAAAKAVDKNAPFGITATRADGSPVAVPPDIMNPEHQKAAYDYVNRTGRVPPAIVEQLDAVRDWSSVETKTAAAAITQNITDIYRKRFTKDGGSAEEQSYLLGAAMREQLGDGVYKKMSSLSADGPFVVKGGLSAAASIENPNREKGGANVVTSESILNTLSGMKDVAFNRGIGSTLSGAGVAVVNALPALFRPEDTVKWGMFENAATRKLFGGLVDQYDGISSNGDGIEADKVSISPALVSALLPYVSGYVATNGEADRREGKDPVKQGLVRGIEAMRDKLSLQRGPDGGYEVQHLAFSHVANGVAQTALPESVWTDVAMARYRAVNPDVAERVGRGTAYVHQTIEPDGRMNYTLVGSDKRTGETLRLMNLDPKDQAWQMETKKLAQAVGKEMGSGVASVLYSVWGGELLLGGIAENKTASMAALAAGRTLPSAQWADFVDALRPSSIYRSLDGKQYDEGLAALRTDEAQKTIARYGSAYHLFFGKSGTDLHLFGGMQEPKLTGKLLPSPNDLAAQRESVANRQIWTRTRVRNERTINGPNDIGNAGP